VLTIGATDRATLAAVALSDTTLQRSQLITDREDDLEDERSLTLEPVDSFVQLLEGDDGGE
jgi:hypothetical protein